MKALFPFLSGFGLAMTIKSEMPDTILCVTLFCIALVATFTLEMRDDS